MDSASKESCYEIDPRRYRKDRVYIGCVVVGGLIWIPLTIFTTYYAYFNFQIFFVLWLALAYLGILSMLFALLIRNRKQNIKIEGEMLVVRGTGILPWSVVRIPKSWVNKIMLGHYNEESVYSLLLHYTKDYPSIVPGDRNISLAQFVHPKDKAVIFDEISRFLRSHNITLTEENEMDEEER